MSPRTSAPPEAAIPSPISGAYRAVWRWHFYAGLLTLPVLCLMALTGALYLFKPEIEDLAYRDVQKVAAGARWTGADRWVGAAEAGLGGKAAAIRVPDRPDRAVQVMVRTPRGERTAFVDPYTARMTGSVGGEGPMGVVKRLHSLELFGKPFNILVEIVAGWAIILVATGVFLWWPRPREAGVWAIRAKDTRSRPFWRDLHAMTGLYAGAVILFLAVTGMPWSTVWGETVLKAMRDAGLGRPKPPAAAPQFVAARGDDAPAGVSWPLQGERLAAGAPTAASPARVLAAAEAARLPRPYTISIPDTPGRAWTASRETVQAEQARTLYIDAATGAVRADIGWTRFGWGAQAFEWGIAVHQGQQYGWLNRIVMLSGCIAIWLLSFSAGVMWWNRRPAGRLGAPVAPPGPRVRAAVLGIVLPLAVIYPLTGLSLLAAVAIDRLWALARSNSLVRSS